VVSWWERLVAMATGALLGHPAAFSTITQSIRFLGGAHELSAHFGQWHQWIVDSMESFLYSGA
jgi:hypothetical protein